jgi:hypothetical protein
MIKPWLELDPNDFSNRWWNMSFILDEEDAKLNKSMEDIKCLFIIQDCNDVGNNYWRCCKWYKNSCNRYFNIIYETNWILNKRLVEIFDGEIVYLLENPDIKFKASNCKYVHDVEQNIFVKILERI